MATKLNETNFNQYHLTFSSAPSSSSMETKKKLNFRDMVGTLKDKASLSKAVLLSKPSTSALHLAVLRATTHDPSNPPDKKQVSVVLSYGHSSRNTAATCIEALMVRLHSTRNAYVAFKCLISIHYVINRGSFILQDQLSVYPSFGGRNYLNFSNFHDNSTSETLNLSFWVRWYARVIESILFTSRNLGFFLYLSVEKDQERVSSLLNQDLVREFDILVTLVEEICRAPELSNVEANRLINEAMNLLTEDKSSVQKQILIRVNELKERLGTLSFSDTIESVCVLKRLESCKEKLFLVFFSREIGTGERLWRLIKELTEMIGEAELGEGKVVKRSAVSESARFSNRVVKQDDSIRYGSMRLNNVGRHLPPLIDFEDHQMDVNNRIEAF